VLEVLFEGRAGVDLTTLFAARACDLLYAGNFCGMKKWKKSDKLWTLFISAHDRLTIDDTLQTDGFDAESIFRYTWFATELQRHARGEMNEIML
jgi:hypothetical protein